MSMNKENRQSHQRTQDVRWKPNAGENHLLQYVSIFFQEILFTMILYWCSPLPVRRLQPAESYNSLSFSSLSWKGATTPYFVQGPCFINFQTGSKKIKWSSSINKSSELPKHQINIYIFFIQQIFQNHPSANPSTRSKYK